jgi:hypothetical protein
LYHFRKTTKNTLLSHTPNRDIFNKIKCVLPPLKTANVEPPPHNKKNKIEENLEIREKYIDQK